MSHESFSQIPELDFESLSDTSTIYTDDCEIRQQHLMEEIDNESRRLLRKYDFLIQLCTEVFSSIKTMSKKDIQENIKRNMIRKAASGDSQNQKM